MFKIVLFYTEITWGQAITLGVVLSATDSVAISSLFKDIRANIRFNTLIEGYH